ncbi:MAG: hypothetical protein EA356_06725 [Geminicoccaceae bacterium]|nr:MAG: hypothetical protein EA356_06725 [Geminicoccaceae bacterium]
MNPASPTIDPAGACSRTPRWQWPIVAIALAMAPLAAPVAAAEPTLRVGFYENPPRLFRDADGTRRGFWPEVIAALARDLEFDYVFVDCDWQACLRQLERGELDLMPDVAFTAERAERFRFGGQPAFYAWSKIVVAENSAVQQLADLAGTRIAVLAGSVQEAGLQELIEQGELDAQVVAVSSFDAAVDAVRAGAADAAVANRHFAEPAARSRGLRGLAFPFQVVSVHLAFAPTMSTTTIHAFDRALYLQQTQAGSAFDRALARWIPVHAPQAPAWLLPAAIATGVLVIGGVGLILLLRRLVERRTRELRATVASLEHALSARDAAEEAARSAQKMEAVGRLTSGIAHDFNNLLTVIVGNLQLLRAQHGPELDAEAAACLDAVEGAAARAGVLTRQLLAFGRKAPLSPEPVELNRLVAEVTNLLRRTLPRAIDLQTELDPAVGLVTVDRSGLANALLNLGLNARDAMPDGGTLRLSTRLDGDSARTEGQVWLTVADTGSGMDSATRERAAEPFFTTKAAGEGSGMGLAMVHGFTAQSGGSLLIESRPGHGTSVSLRLPRQGELARVAARAAAAPAVAV